MIWMKNLLKRMKISSSRGGDVLVWGQGKWTWRHRNTITNTANPKGKAGKVVYHHWWHRNFENGNKKWEFIAFGKKSSTFANAEGFIASLEKRGYENLGSGAFSTVLGKKGFDRVIKVIRRPDGWIDYAVWAAKQGEAGKFAPKVFSYKKIKGKKADFSVAIVERLKYTVDETPRDHALKILPDLLYRAKDNPMAASFADTLAPGIRQFMAGLSKQFDEGRFDLHQGNLMLRENGTFVVVDPIAGGATEDYKRLRAGDFTPALANYIAPLIGFKLLNAHSLGHRSQWINQSHRSVGHCM